MLGAAALRLPQDAPLWFTLATAYSRKGAQDVACLLFTKTWLLAEASSGPAVSVVRPPHVTCVALASVPSTQNCRNTAHIYKVLQFSLLRENLLTEQVLAAAQHTMHCWRQFTTAAICMALQTEQVLAAARHNALLVSSKLLPRDWMCALNDPGVGALNDPGVGGLNDQGGGVLNDQGVVCSMIKVCVRSVVQV